MVTPQQRTAIRKVAQAIGVTRLSDAELGAVQARAVRTLKAHPELSAAEVYRRSIRAVNSGARDTERGVEGAARRALAAGAAPSSRALADFARRVHAAARASRSGRFGGGKVFVNHVWRTGFRSEMSLDDFKRRLVEAHRAGLVSLSRADLVEAMDPRDVEESTVRYLGHVTWNFVGVP